MHKADQFRSLLPFLREPFRTRALIAGLDFPGLMLLIQWSVVHGRVGDVKTEYSLQCVSTPEGWLFANPATSRPLH